MLPAAAITSLQLRPPLLAGVIPFLSLVLDADPQVAEQEDQEPSARTQSTGQESQKFKYIPNWVLIGKTFNLKSG